MDATAAPATTHPSTCLMVPSPLCAPSVRRSPHLLRHVRDVRELALDGVERERPGTGVAREAALRTQAKLGQIDRLGSLVDTPLQRVGVFELGVLRADDADRNALAL